MPTYGNHEVLLGEGYEPWAKRFATPPGFDGRRYYSFDAGDVHFVSIFAVANPGSAAGAPRSTGSRTTSSRPRARWPALGRSLHARAAVLRRLRATAPTSTCGRSSGRFSSAWASRSSLTSHDQNYERTYPLRDIGGANQPTSAARDCYTLEDGVSWVKVSPAGKLSNHHGLNNFSHFLTTPPQLGPPSGTPRCTTSPACAPGTASCASRRGGMAPPTALRSRPR